MDSIFDDHMHLRADGFFLDAARKFRRAGGTAFNLVNLPDYSIGPARYYETLYARTIGLAETVRRELNICSLVTIGPYPLDYFYFEKAGYDPWIMMTDGISLAGKIISEGRADAIGEIGRPHFPVGQNVVDQCNAMIELALGIAKDCDSAVVLHTEDLGSVALENLGKMCDRSGIERERVIKHHARPDNLGVISGLSASILASRSNIREALKLTLEFMLETDYVDDPSKPDKVIPVDSVPKRAIMIKGEYDNWEEIFQKIFVDVPLRAYRRESFLCNEK
ncbi:MAG: TatD family hydrolase [Thermoplasmataceae archaeon]